MYHQIDKQAAGSAENMLVLITGTSSTSHTFIFVVLATFTYQCSPNSK